MASSADELTIKEEEEECLRGAQQLQPAQCFPRMHSASARIEILHILFLKFSPSYFLQHK